MALGETRAWLASLGLFGGVVLGDGRIGCALAAGARAGLARMSGEPAASSGVAGDSVTRPWLGPAVTARLSAGGARVAALLSVEGGWVVRGAQGLAGGTTAIAIEGGWVTVAAGVRFDRPREPISRRDPLRGHEPAHQAWFGHGLCRCRLLQLEGRAVRRRGPSRRRSIPWRRTSESNPCDGAGTAIRNGAPMCNFGEPDDGGAAGSGGGAAGSGGAVAGSGGGFAGSGGAVAGSGGERGRRQRRLGWRQRRVRWPRRNGRGLRKRSHRPLRAPVRVRAELWRSDRVEQLLPVPGAAVRQLRRHRLPRHGDADRHLRRLRLLRRLRPPHDRQARHGPRSLRQGYPREAGPASRRPQLQKRQPDGQLGPRLGRGVIRGGSGLDLHDVRRAAELRSVNHRRDDDDVWHRIVGSHFGELQSLGHVPVLYRHQDRAGSTPPTLPPRRPARRCRFREADAGYFSSLSVSTGSPRCACGSSSWRS